jgi:hypothetical protein
MNQRLASPSQRVRRSGPSAPDRWHTAAPDRFTLQVRLRGQMGPACETLCTGLEEALRFGQREFPAFPERNPWIGLDWLQRKIWILLDPETHRTR